MLQKQIQRIDYILLFRFLELVYQSGKGDINEKYTDKTEYNAIF